jgi:hypothetical protein
MVLIFTSRNILGWIYNQSKESPAPIPASINGYFTISGNMSGYAHKTL